jgi:glycosyltransferase involved in cell wall biosynthesis
MKIGIDISQIVYEGTGVARYVRSVVSELLARDRDNEYVLFGASLRRISAFRRFFEDIRHLNGRVRLVVVPIPPTLMEIVWNRLHVVPVEFFVGRVDVFWSSDWTQPPLSGARGITTIHDVSILRYPKSFNPRIVSIQKRRMARAKAVCRAFLCDSEATKRDTMSFLGIPDDRLHVVYPGFSDQT